ncbi:hypothetical protein RchiOBHm_Chr5g0046921 [Rosa chinensis]|uniref:Uncharacterized protein n=1 Tax=Rosa chinensis TaxID=74649 RepID=A0A2P6QE96_ROSCH|nr:hypothetical protein RchiOBHm_Chr5g0046921 [Rosa chinensis]
MKRRVSWSLYPKPAPFMEILPRFGFCVLALAVLDGRVLFKESFGIGGGHACEPKGF